MELSRYQKDGIRLWTENNFRTAWFWEPGVGKTFTAIWLCKELIKRNKVKRIVVVVPSCLVTMWSEDLKDQGVGDDLFTYLPLKRMRVTDKPEPDNERILLISYSLLSTRKLPEADMYILDESHNIKNYKSKAYLLLKSTIKPTDKLILMTGTPAPNGEEDFFSQVTLVKPGVLGSNITQYRRRFFYLFNAKFFIYRLKESMKENLYNLLYTCCSFIRTKDVLDLPSKNFIPLRYELEPAQRRLYREVKLNKCITGSVNEGEQELLPVPSPSIRARMLQMICSGFVKMDLTLPDGFGKVDIDIEPETLSEKEQILLNKLEQFHSLKEQALVWINFIATAERLKRIIPKKYKYRVIVGGMSEKIKQKYLQEYVDGKLDFILAHPLTLGTGINQFRTTRYMLYYELSPDHGAFEQSVARIWRRGQTNPVFIYLFVGRKCIDTHIYNLLKNKGDVKDVIFRGYLENNELD